MASFTHEDASKPLPRLPLYDELPPFTPAATAHLKKILTQGLERENLSIQWLSHIEEALLDLAEAARKGEWTTGIKQKRLMAGLSTGPTGASTIDFPNEDKAQQSEPPPQESIPLDELWKLLEDRIHKSSVPAPASTPSLLILTQSPYEPGHHFPDLGIGFDIRPHREACVFTAASFSLPYYTADNGQRRGQGGRIVAGMEEWRSK